jgi:anaerobic selenocysteine-containing dehydrogenase
MSEWKKTTCVLCANLCGLEVRIENNQIVRSRGDMDNLISQGYACRKGLNIRYHQHHADRLLYPLKRVGDRFERISWDQAIEEIAAGLKAIVDQHGPRSLALMGGGTIGCMSQGAFSVGLLRAMGSQYFYNAIAQELTGRYWADGECFGNQNRHTVPDLEHTDMVLMVGKNPMMSHHSPRARKHWPAFAKDPDSVLVVVDPRVSETAKLADIHLALRPGTDALLYRAMISIILQKNWQNQAYMDEHVSGFDKIRPLFENFDARSAIEVCELDYDQVVEVCRLFATRRSSHESDLGVLMNRHSTLVSYLENVLRAICGRIGVKGGNLFGTGLMSGGPTKIRNRDKEALAWRTAATEFFPITNLYPPNVMPEEILNDDSDRLRTVMVSGANPLRSFADTSQYEKAFGALDLLVTVDIAMTETAALSHYVLPALSAYESYDAGMQPHGFPDVFMQVRHPVVEPQGEQLEAAEIFTRLADALGLVPEFPEKLHEAADSGDRLRFGMELMTFAGQNPNAKQAMQYILAKTLGRSMGSVNLAWQWSRLVTMPPWAQEKAVRAGFTPGPAIGDDLFQAVIDAPGGLIVGSADPDEWDHFKAIATADGRINLDVPEMLEWLHEIDPARELEDLNAGQDAYPLIMSSGLHFDGNANTQMRDPAWNEGKTYHWFRMHPDDAARQGLEDGQMVRVITEAGQETIELKIDATTRPGYVLMPHGFGLVHRGKTYGANANRLAKNTNRDRLAGTPLHRYIRCRVEKV